MTATKPTNATNNKNKKSSATFIFADLSFRVDIFIIRLQIQA
jgi:hypothetical protein